MQSRSLTFCIENLHRFGGCRAYRGLYDGRLDLGLLLLLDLLHHGPLVVLRRLLGVTPAAAPAPVVYGHQLGRGHAAAVGLFVVVVPDDGYLLRQLILALGRLSVLPGLQQPLLRLLPVPLGRLLLPVLRHGRLVVLPGLHHFLLLLLLPADLGHSLPPVPGVYVGHVRPEVLLAAEAVVADLALERLHVAVRHDVELELVEPVKLFETVEVIPEGTLELFLRAVGQGVPGQLVLAVELGLALVALEGQLAGVYDRVGLERVLVDKALAAEGAGVALLVVDRGQVLT